MALEKGEEQDRNINGDSIFFKHAGSDFKTVIKDVLSTHPEESFCFLNEGKLREKVGIFREHFLPEMEERKIIYAMKANPKRRILKILREEGIDGFDCASLNEVREALLHVSDAGVFFSNPVTTAKTIRYASSRGVSYFTAQSRAGVEKILQNAQNSPEIVIRLQTLNEEAKINLSTKYGISAEETKELLRFTRNKTDNTLYGICINMGSQNTSPETFEKGIEYMADVARSEGGVSSIDIGGGIPVNYFEDDKFDIRQILDYISQSIRANLKGVLRSDANDPKIIIEPGRSIIADSVDLTIPILGMEYRGNKRTIYINDGVFMSFSDAVIHDWKYEFDVFTKDGREISESRNPCIVYGNTCDSGDTLGEILLPTDLREGDFLWVRNAGAYMDSQASHFNGFEPPHYVAYNRQ